MRPQTAGLIAHTGKAGVAQLINAVAEEFRRFSVPVLFEEKTAALSGRNSSLSVRDLARQVDLLVVLGGDGTILHVVGSLADDIKPVFGINLGSLGFLTCANSSAYREAVAGVVGGEMVFSDRTLLSISMTNAAGEPLTLTALNDAVFSRGELSRLIRLKTRVNGEALTEFNADGLIVATPTGSTAYSLSAGGPILTPDSEALVITPICPHVVTNRSVIVSEQSLIEVEASERDHPVYLTVDGRAPLRVPAGGVVAIRKSERVLPLAALPDVSFFSVVRQKLKWSGSNV